MSDLFGIRVIESDALPIYPDHGTDARRIVRRGLADVLTWLGEDVGPEPGAPTHALLVGDSLHASALFVDMLREETDHA